MVQPDFEIVLGTYEQYLLGYKYNDENSKLTQSFAAHDHSSSIRCLDISKNLMASGGTDDRIFIYNLRTRQEQCMLTHHTSTINCLQFTKDHTHLVSGSADGNITITRIGNWQNEKIWDKAHKGAAILDVAIHPSGKLMLSLASDCSLRTWNLIKGRQAYVVNLNSKSKDPRSLQHISWAPCGVRFVLYGGKCTEIWSIETGGLLLSIEHASKTTCCLWLSNEKFLVGYESGQIGKVKAAKGDIKVVDAHKERVKCMNAVGKWLVTASSAGEIKVWDRKSLTEVAKVDCGCRITCMGLIPPSEIKKEADDEEIQVSESESVTNVQEIQTKNKTRTSDGGGLKKKAKKT